jgi:GntR family transcriptional regulator / MocR family aminotransferase
MLPALRLDRHAPQPLHEQLTGQLRRLILQGALPPGTRLPPSRDVARELGVSRKLAVLAYEQLRAEGYLEARVGSGTRVRSSLPAHLLRPEAPTGPIAVRSAGPPAAPRANPPHHRRALDSGAPGPLRDRGAPPPPRLSRQGTRLAASRGIPDRAAVVRGAFRPGTTRPGDFPVRTWTRISTALWREEAPGLIHYGDARGLPALREAIADHVRRYRAVRCTPEQVMVTSGSQQALDLVARMLVDPGDPVGVEEPGYRGARLALAAAGARLHPIPVDTGGLRIPDPQAGEAPLPPLRLVYTTPSHQYPLGTILTLERRLRLLEWARDSGGWIVEDDYDSEFRYESRPLPALQGLDGAGRVIYVGTLSKVLAPGLRVGFLVLPEALVDPFQAARRAVDVHSPLILQATMARFIRQGHLERHIARLRGAHDQRREALREALTARLGGALELVGGEAGLHLTALLPPGTDDRRISVLAGRRGIEAPALSDYCLGTPVRTGLVLGYGAVAPREIPPAVELLAAAVEEALPGG